MLPVQNQTIMGNYLAAITRLEWDLASVAAKVTLVFFPIIALFAAMFDYLGLGSVNGDREIPKVKISLAGLGQSIELYNRKRLAVLMEQIDIRQSLVEPALGNTKENRTFVKVESLRDEIDARITDLEQKVHSLFYQVVNPAQKETIYKLKEKPELMAHKELLQTLSTQSWIQLNNEFLLEVEPPDLYKDEQIPQDDEAEFYKRLLDLKFLIDSANDAIE